MFTRPETVHPETHRTLRFSRNQPYDFAREAMLLPLAASELEQAAREMPIVFPNGEGAPQALVGLEPGRNLHVQDSGHWKGRYVPACLKAYPFRLAKHGEAESEASQQFVVQIDRDARHFDTPDGEPLIDEQGGPAPLLKQAQKALTTLYKDTRRAEQQVALLDEHGLLVAQHILVNRGTDQERALTGFRVVDAKALAALSGDALATLRDAGALRLIYAHQLSLTNLRDGLLAHEAKGATQRPNLEALFDGDDDLTFDFDS
ncbi:SapC family protein [Halomonas sp.]|uniref:SapC family protein n=1 Tax=Halomonas sp. TaxID=1486246 RepID=UPI003D122EA9